MSLEGPCGTEAQTSKEGVILAMLVSLNLEEGLVGQGPREHADWCGVSEGHTVRLVL